MLMYYNTTLTFFKERAGVNSPALFILFHASKL